MSGSPTIVIDSGAYLTRVGISGRDVPEETFRTVVGRPKEGVDGAGDSVFVGEEAYENRSTLALSHPVDRYTITNMDDMEHIWQYCFSDILGCDSIEEISVLMTDGPVSDELKIKNRTKMAEAMFEKYNVPAFYVAMQPFLSLNSIEKTTGLVLDIGDSMVSSVPVVEGVVVTSGVLTTDIASGRFLTDYLMKMLNEQDGVSITDREIVTAIKEKLSYVACDFEGEFKWGDSTTRDYTLPDGQVISVGTERFRCGESLFQPSLLGTDAADGIHKLVHKSIQRCDESARSALYEDIVLAGGSSLMSKLPDRLKKEVLALAADETRVKVLTSPTRALSAWLGGSLLAASDDFPEMSVSKKEYQENGSAIVNTKCTN